MKKGLFSKVSKLFFAFVGLLGVTACNGVTTKSTTTQAPTTQAPTTQAPTTQAPTTQAPTTQAPTTQAPTTQQTTTITTGNNSEDWLANFNYITIEEAFEIANAAGTSGTTESYYVYGTIKSIVNPTYGEMYITDGVRDLYIYGSTNENGDFYNKLEDKPIKGDEILLYGILKTYNGAPEMGRSVIAAFKHVETEIDVTDYQEVTVAQAREAQKDAKLKVTGVVANITYANGYIPDGFVLVDNTSSIYVYGEVAQQVEPGNKVTLVGEKTYFIAENEQSNANTFGYKGACQIGYATIISNDKGNNAVDFSWAEEVSVKDIMTTSYSDNITSLVYKVNVLVTKAPGNGFVNYYMNDLDGYTGSYVYTKCNGGDYEWLDEFDGKICTVYLTAINAKSTATGCTWRFVPVKVVYEDFEFAANDAPEFAIEYYAKDQFKQEYTADPSLELVTSVSSELLKIENVTLEYTSNDTNVVYFETVDSKVVFHTKNTGTAEITIKATYGEHFAEYKLNVTVEQQVVYDALTVAEGIAAQEETTVIVKGVVTSGVTNKAAGFYLSDDTGIVAVELANAAEMAEIKIGDLIVVEGTRTVNINKGAATKQIVINSATVLSNEFGGHAHSTESFVEMTAEDLLVNYSKKDQFTSAQGYIVTGVVSKFEAQFYTNFYFGVGEASGTNIQVYAANGNQLSFLDQFVGQTVTVELLFSDWNNKSDGYRLYILAVRTADGKVINDINFK